MLFSPFLLECGKHDPHLNYKKSIRDSTLLSDVLAALDIEGTPDDVVITDMDYLTAEK